MFKYSALIGATLTWCGLLGCSDPVPPSAEGALTTSISQSTLPDQSCTTPRGPMSIGEYSNVLLGGAPGTNRIVDGTNGSVACNVISNGTGFRIGATINADALEKNAVGIPYHQEFALHANYPALTTHAPGATASISATDTNTQTNRADSACTLDVISLGQDGTGGALFATFVCSNFIDSNTPGSGCRMTGTIVLENCGK
jgi:hypothetical protein